MDMVLARTSFGAALLFLATLAGPPGAAAAGGIVDGGAIYIKGGAMRLQHDTQVFDALSLPNLITVNLEDTSSRVINVGWEIRFRRGWAVGTEYLGYKHQFTPAASPTAQGIATTKALMVSGRKYFFDSGNFHPYVGGGIGIGETEINNRRSAGTVDRFDFSLFLHVVLGIEARFNNMSIMLEARHLASGRDNSFDVEYDPSVTGVLLGMGFNW